MNEVSMKSYRAINLHKAVYLAGAPVLMPVFAHPDQYRNKYIKATKKKDEGNEISNRYPILRIEIIKGKDFERRWSRDHDHGDPQNHHNTGNSQQHQFS